MNHPSIQFVQSLRTACAALCVALAAALPVTALAQSTPTANDYPARAVKIVVPFAPGGATDTLARLTGTSLERRFKQSFIVENKPGGQTLIGVDAVVKSPADGYTLLVSAGNVVSEQVLNKDWPIRIDRDLTPLSVFGGGGYALTVSTATGIKTLKELVEYVKANPGKLNHGEAGAISPEVAILKYRIGMPHIESIIYKGGPLAVQAVLANEVQFYAAATLDVAALHKNGKLRVIAYTEKERHPLIPDVPTVNESNVGVSDFDMGYWFTLMGPANMQPAIATKINAATMAMVKEPEFVEKANAFGMRTYSPNLPETRARINEGVRVLDQALAAGIKLR